MESLDRSFIDAATRVLIARGNRFDPKPKKRKPKSLIDLPPGKDVPYWWNQIQGALETVENSGFEEWDRAMVQALFDVSQQTAWRIMLKLGARRIGRQLVVTRQQLLDGLQATFKDHRYQAETERAEARRERIAALRPPPSRIIKEYATPQAAMKSRSVSELPPTIRFSQGMCWIIANDGQELMEQLLAIAETLNRGLDGFDAIDLMLKGG